MKTNKDSLAKKTPAIVLGAGITALGVVRCLSRFNVKTYLISDRNDFVKCSRGVQPILLNTNPFPTPEEISDMLKNLDVAEAVLLPCSDPFLKAVVALPPELKSRFPSSLPSPETLNSLVNKGKFARVLKEVNIPHPETLIIDSADQLKTLDARYFNQYFYKPFDSKEFQHAFLTKALRVSSREDALHKFKEIQSKGQAVMLQEYLPGPANRHYFVDGFRDKEGEFRAFFARRRERIFPPDFGNSSYCVSVPPETVSDALVSIRKLLKHIDYRGIFSAEFKYDERDNLFKILEVNARPWWYIEFANQCGVSTCQMAYRDALGLPVKSIETYDVGVGCMYGFDDFRVALNMFLKQDLSLFNWIKEFFASKNPIFSWSDPIPAIYCSIERPFRYLKKRIKRLTGSNL